MIELTGFGKDYGDFTAVQSLDLKIEEGEMFGFIGPNGAGKSTSIRFLATLLRATRGEGTVNGFSVSKQPMDVRRSVGYMPDAFGVYDGMKVWEFLDFFAVAYQIGRTQRKRVIADVLELLDLTYKRDDFVNGLSRGMKQRLCLAKTLVHDPPVLILDEPASGLDPRARIEMRNLLRKLGQTGKTIIVSSHILPELADICNKIGIIDRGVMSVSAEVSEVMKQVRDRTILHVGVAEKEDGAKRVLEDHALVDSVTQGDGFLVVTLIDNTSDYSGIPTTLVQEGFRISLFQEEEINLESAFMALTKGTGANF